MGGHGFLEKTGIRVRTEQSLRKKQVEGDGPAPRTESQLTIL